MNQAAFLDWPVFLVAGLFVIVNVLARFSYSVSDGVLMGRWRVLAVIPLLKSQIRIDDICRIERFSWRKHALKRYVPFGRPFSRQGTMIFFRDGRIPMYVSPPSHDSFARMVRDQQKQSLNGVNGDVVEN